MFAIVMTVFVTSVVWASLFFVIVHHFSKEQKKAEETFVFVHKQNVENFSRSLLLAHDEFQELLEKREQQWKDTVAKLTGTKKTSVPSA